MMLALVFRNYGVRAPRECDMEIAEFWLRAMRCGELWLWGDHKCNCVIDYHP